MSRKNFSTIDAYIASFPRAVRHLLEELRRTIQKEAPRAEECINYGIPTFKFYGNLVHFAAFKKHIGFYPTSSGITAFKKQLLRYKHAKGSVQFPLNEPLPLIVVKNIVKFRVKENMKKKAVN